VTLDSSAVIGLLDRRDPHHAELHAALGAASRPHLLPATVLCEIGWYSEQRLPAATFDRFLGSVESGELKLDCGERDIPRVRGLIARYAELGLGSADAFVAACAERNGGRVLTLDRRHFDVLGRELGLTVLPA
jgi:predicted nucleic acid-binding protein